MTPQISTGPEVIGPYKVHPVAALFPLMEGEAYAELKQSIHDHGQQEPIVVHDGVLIDGRNRYRACIDLGIEPRVEVYALGIPVEEYILTANLHRRHLTDDQRMMIAAEALRMKEAEAAQARMMAGAKQGGRGRRKNPAANSTQGLRAPETSKKIAALVNGTDHQARQALAVAKHAPELVEEVKTGRMPLKKAYKKAHQHKPSKRVMHDPDGLGAERLRYINAHCNAESTLQRTKSAFQHLLSKVKQCPEEEERMYMAEEVMELAEKFTGTAEELMNATNQMPQPGRAEPWWELYKKASHKIESGFADMLSALKLFPPGWHRREHARTAMVQAAIFGLSAEELMKAADEQMRKEAAEKQEVTNDQR